MRGEGYDTRRVKPCWKLCLYRRVKNTETFLNKFEVILLSILNDAEFSTKEDEKIDFLIARQ